MNRMSVNHEAYSMLLLRIPMEVVGDLMDYSPDPLVGQSIWKSSIGSLSLSRPEHFFPNQFLKGGWGIMILLLYVYPF
jgi:hypothetical protein